MKLISEVVNQSTNATMVENQRLYASIGYEETGRGTEAGYDRVFMRKQLID